MGFMKGLIQAVLWIGGACGVVAGILRAFFVDVYTVPHNGMAPTAVYGDKVAVWRKAAADFGNVMLCEHPAEPGNLVIGRVLAFAGHSVSSDRLGNLYVDSDRATTEPLGPKRFYDVTQNQLVEMEMMNVEFGTNPTYTVFKARDSTFELGATQIEQGMFLLGDNLTSPMTDSREFGPVDPAGCKGQVFMRLKPAPANDDDIDHGYLQFL